MTFITKYQPEKQGIMVKESTDGVFFDNNELTILGDATVLGTVYYNTIECITAPKCLNSTNLSGLVIQIGDTKIEQNSLHTDTIQSTTFNATIVKVGSNTEIAQSIMTNKIDSDGMTANTLSSDIFNVHANANVSGIKSISMESLDTSGHIKTDNVSFTNSSLSVKDFSSESVDVLNMNLSTFSTITSGSVTATTISATNFSMTGGVLTINDIPNITTLSGHSLNALDNLLEMGVTECAIDGEITTGTIITTTLSGSRVLIDGTKNTINSLGSVDTEQVKLSGNIKVSHLKSESSDLVFEDIININNVTFNPDNKCSFQTINTLNDVSGNINNIVLQSNSTINIDTVALTGDTIIERLVPKKILTNEINADTVNNTVVSDTLITTAILSGKDVLVSDDIDIHTIFSTRPLLIDANADIETTLFDDGDIEAYSIITCREIKTPVLLNVTNITSTEHQFGSAWINGVLFDDDGIVLSGVYTTPDIYCNTIRVQTIDYPLLLNNVYGLSTNGIIGRDMVSSGTIASLDTNTATAISVSSLSDIHTLIADTISIQEPIASLTNNNLVKPTVHSSGTVTVSNNVEAGSINNAMLDVRYITTVHAVSETNITLSGTSGENMAEGLVILVNNQTDPVENGIYIVKSDSWVRHPLLLSGDDAKNAAVTTPESIIYVNTETCTVGTDQLSFSIYSGIDIQQPTLLNNTTTLDDGDITTSNSITVQTLSAQNITVGTFSLSQGIITFPAETTINGITTLSDHISGVSDITSTNISANDIDVTVLSVPVITGDTTFGGVDFKDSMLSSINEMTVTGDVYSNTLDVFGDIIVSKYISNIQLTPTVAISNGDISTDVVQADSIKVANVEIVAPNGSYILDLPNEYKTEPHSLTMFTRTNTNDNLWTITPETSSVGLDTQIQYRHNSKLASTSDFVFKRTASLGIQISSSGYTLSNTDHQFVNGTYSHQQANVSFDVVVSLPSISLVNIIVNSGTYNILKPIPISNTILKTKKLTIDNTITFADNTFNNTANDTIITSDDFIISNGIKFNNAHLGNKSVFDAVSNSSIAISSDGTFVGVAQPTIDMHPATKEYADTNLQKFEWTQSVDCVYKYNLDNYANNAYSDVMLRMVDGVELQNGSTLLLIGQTNPVENGIFISSENQTVLTRIVTGDVAGKSTHVRYGDENENAVYVCISTSAIAGSEPCVYTKIVDGKYNLSEELTEDGEIYKNVDHLVHENGKLTFAQNIPSTLLQTTNFTIVDELGTKTLTLGLDTSTPISISNNKSFLATNETYSKKKTFNKMTSSGDVSVDNTIIVDGNVLSSDNPLLSGTVMTVGNINKKIDLVKYTAETIYNTDIDTSNLTDEYSLVIDQTDASRNGYYNYNEKVDWITPYIVNDRYIVYPDKIQDSHMDNFDSHIMDSHIVSTNNVVTSNIQPDNRIDIDTSIIEHKAIIANTLQVDRLIFKDQVAVNVDATSTSDISPLSGTDLFQKGKIVLVKDNTQLSQNGVYTVSEYDWIKIQTLFAKDQNGVTYSISKDGTVLPFIKQTYDFTNVSSIGNSYIVDYYSENSLDKTGSTVDGIQVLDGETVLVKDDGIYKITEANWIKTNFIQENETCMIQRGNKYSRLSFIIKDEKTVLNYDYIVDCIIYNNIDINSTIQKPNGAIILLSGQTVPSENGLYVVGTDSQLTRYETMEGINTIISLEDYTIITAQDERVFYVDFNLTVDYYNVPTNPVVGDTYTDGDFIFKYTLDGVFEQIHAVLDSDFIYIIQSQRTLHRNAFVDYISKPNSYVTISGVHFSNNKITNVAEIKSPHPENDITIDIPTISSNNASSVLIPSEMVDIPNGTVITKAADTNMNNLYANDVTIKKNAMISGDIVYDTLGVYSDLKLNDLTIETDETNGTVMSIDTIRAGTGAFSGTLSTHVLHAGSIHSENQILFQHTNPTPIITIGKEYIVATTYKTDNLESLHGTNPLQNATDVTGNGYINGKKLSLQSKVLLVGQTNTTENGLYLVKQGDWERIENPDNKPYHPPGKYFDHLFNEFIPVENTVINVNTNEIDTPVYTVDTSVTLSSVVPAIATVFTNTSNQITFGMISSDIDIDTTTISITADNVNIDDIHTTDLTISKNIDISSLTTNGNIMATKILKFENAISLNSIDISNINDLCINIDLNCTNLVTPSIKHPGFLDIRSTTTDTVVEGAIFTNKNPISVPIFNEYPFTGLHPHGKVSAIFDTVPQLSGEHTNLKSGDIVIVRQPPGDEESVQVTITYDTNVKSITLSQYSVVQSIECTMPGFSAYFKQTNPTLLVVYIHHGTDTSPGNQNIDIIINYKEYSQYNGVYTVKQDNWERVINDVTDTVSLSVDYYNINPDYPALFTLPFSLSSNLDVSDGIVTKLTNDAYMIHSENNAFTISYNNKTATLKNVFTMHNKLFIQNDLLQVYEKSWLWVNYTQGENIQLPTIDNARRITVGANVVLPGMTIFLFGQTNSKENGLYVYRNGLLVRPDGYNERNTMFEFIWDSYSGFGFYVYGVIGNFLLHFKTSIQHPQASDKMTVDKMTVSAIDCSLADIVVFEAGKNITIDVDTIHSDYINLHGDAIITTPSMTIRGSLTTGKTLNVSDSAITVGGGITSEGDISIHGIRYVTINGFSVSSSGLTVTNATIDANASIQKITSDVFSNDTGITLPDFTIGNIILKNNKLTVSKFEGTLSEIDTQTCNTSEISLETINTSSPITFITGKLTAMKIFGTSIDIHKMELSNIISSAIAPKNTSVFTDNINTISAFTNASTIALSTISKTNDESSIISINCKKMDMNADTITIKRPVTFSTNEITIYGNISADAIQVSNNLSIGEAGDSVIIGSDILVLSNKLNTVNFTTDNQIGSFMSSAESVSFGGGASTLSVHAKDKTTISSSIVNISYADTIPEYNWQNPVDVICDYHLDLTQSIYRLNRTTIIPGMTVLLTSNGVYNGVYRVLMDNTLSYLHAVELSHAYYERYGQEKAYYVSQVGDIPSIEQKLLTIAELETYSAPTDKAYNAVNTTFTECDTLHVSFTVTFTTGFVNGAKTGLYYNNECKVSYSKDNKEFYAMFIYGNYPYNVHKTYVSIGDNGAVLNTPYNIKAIFYLKTEYIHLTVNDVVGTFIPGYAPAPINWVTNKHIFGYDNWYENNTTNPDNASKRKLTNGVINDIKIQIPDTTNQPVNRSYLVRDINYNTNEEEKTINIDYNNSYIITYTFVIKFEHVKSSFITFMECNGNSLQVNNQYIKAIFVCGYNDSNKTSSVQVNIQTHKNYTISVTYDYSVGSVNLLVDNVTGTNTNSFNDNDKQLFKYMSPEMKFKKDDGIMYEITNFSCYVPGYSPSVPKVLNVIDTLSIVGNYTPNNDSIQTVQIESKLLDSRSVITIPGKVGIVKNSDTFLVHSFDETQQTQQMYRIQLFDYHRRDTIVLPSSETVKQFVFTDTKYKFDLVREKVTFKFKGHPQLMFSGELLDSYSSIRKPGYTNFNTWLIKVQRVSNDDTNEYTINLDYEFIVHEYHNTVTTTINQIADANYVYDSGTGEYARIGISLSNTESIIFQDHPDLDIQTQNGDIVLRPKDANNIIESINTSINYIVKETTRPELLMSLLPGVSIINRTDPINHKRTINKNDDTILTQSSYDISSIDKTSEQLIFVPERIYSSYGPAEILFNYKVEVDSLNRISVEKKKIAKDVSSDDNESFRLSVYKTRKMHYNHVRKITTNGSRAHINIPTNETFSANSHLATIHIYKLNGYNEYIYKTPIHFSDFVNVKFEQIDGFIFSVRKISSNEFKIMAFITAASSTASGTTTVKVLFINGKHISEYTHLDELIHTSVYPNVVEVAEQTNIHTQDIELPFNTDDCITFISHNNDKVDVELIDTKLCIIPRDMQGTYSDTFTIQQFPTTNEYEKKKIVSRTDGIISPITVQWLYFDTENIIELPHYGNIPDKNIKEYFNFYYGTKLKSFDDYYQPQTWYLIQHDSDYAIIEKSIYENNNYSSFVAAFADKNERVVSLNENSMIFDGTLANKGVNINIVNNVFTIDVSKSTYDPEIYKVDEFTVFYKTNNDTGDTDFIQTQAHPRSDNQTQPIINDIIHNHNVTIIRLNEQFTGFVEFSAYDLSRIEFTNDKNDTTIVQSVSKSVFNTDPKIKEYIDANENVYVSMYPALHTGYVNLMVNKPTISHNNNKISANTSVGNYSTETETMVTNRLSYSFRMNTTTQITHINLENFPELLSDDIEFSFDVQCIDSPNDVNRYSAFARIDKQNKRLYLHVTRLVNSNSESNWLITVLPKTETYSTVNII